MNHLPPYINYPVLENDFVLLREITKVDIPSIRTITTYDRVLAKSDDEAWEFIEKIKHNYNQGESIHWGIVDKKTNQIIGTCGYYRGFINSRGELGCILLPEFRGKGFTKIALELAIQYGYETLQLNVVFAITNKSNKQAIRLLEKMNFYFTKEMDEFDFEMVHQRINNYEN